MSRCRSLFNFFSRNPIKKKNYLPRLLAEHPYKLAMNLQKEIERLAEKFKHTEFQYRDWLAFLALTYGVVSQSDILSYDLCQGSPQKRIELLDFHQKKIQKTFFIFAGLTIGSAALNKIEGSDAGVLGSYLLMLPTVVISVLYTHIASMKDEVRKLQKIEQDILERNDELTNLCKDNNLSLTALSLPQIKADANRYILEQARYESQHGLIL